MLITAIEPRKKGLSALYIDGEFAMKIDTETLISNKIDVATEIDDDTLHRIIELSDVKRAKNKALWLISYRDYSKKELTEKIKLSYPEKAAIQAVERMEELGLINDESYALRYASDLINLKHLSKSAAVIKLTQKGIDRSLASEIVDEFDVDPCEHIKTLIEKKYAKSLFDEKGRRRTVNALMRLGYHYSDIKSALNDYLEYTEYEE